MKLLEENNLPKIWFHDLKAISQLLGHASTIITSNVYFDKNKIIVDCADELNGYISRVNQEKK